MPFSGIESLLELMLKVMNGKRPSRPPEGKELGLSDGLWELIRTSLAHEAEERPLASTFVDLLEKAIPDIAVLEKLVEFDVDSEEHIQKLHHMFEHTDNTLLGMRENEILVVIEVFDRVSLAHHLFALFRCLTWSGFRFLTPCWKTRGSTADAYTGFRKSPPSVAFCRRATGSPTVASPELVVPQSQRGYPALASG